MNERVTAGIPSLSPQKRGTIDHGIASRARQNSLQAEREGKKLAAAAKDAGRDTTNKKQQEGIQLHGFVISERLKKLNHSLWFETAKADNTRIGVYYFDPTKQQRFYIGGFFRELNPEFETAILDKDGECKRTIPGWRTLLRRLISKGFISEPRAYVVFGPPSRQSERWFRAIA